MSRNRWWALLVLGSTAVLALDIATGPYILFPVAFIFPVSLASWFLGRNAGLFLTVMLVGCRLGIGLWMEAEVIPTWATVVNSGIRLMILGVFAFLVAKVAEQKKELENRVQLLEGILPICAFCKKIRRTDGTWERIESYIADRSQASFSHGFCEACAREHYPEAFSNRANGSPN